MYAGTLLLHSWIRWAVIIAGLFAVIRPRDGKAGLWFTILLDIQFLVGLCLYLFISPNTTAAMRDFAGSMAHPAVRFWLVEHPTGMIVALVLAHVARARARKSSRAGGSRTPAILYAISLVVLLAAQPWPGLPYGRPLIRLPG